ncbi:putative cyclic nucleotide-gated ion channel 15 [Drosera capensis]
MVDFLQNRIDPTILLSLLGGGSMRPESPAAAGEGRRWQLRRGGCTSNQKEMKAQIKWVLRDTRSPQAVKSLQTPLKKADISNTWSKKPNAKKAGNTQGGSSVKDKVLSRVFSEDYGLIKRKILDPRGSAIRRWNRIFLMSCLVSLFVDPIFFFLPRVKSNEYCIMNGKNLEILLIWGIIPILKGGSIMGNTKNGLRLILLFQYLPRLLLIFPLSSKIIKTTAVVTEAAWPGAAYNLMLFLLASHVNDPKRDDWLKASNLTTVIPVVRTYLQLTTVRLEEWRINRTDTEEWMHHRQLPEELKQAVRKYDQYKWVATQGVDEEALLESLPSDLRRDIKRHVCLDLVRQGGRTGFFNSCRIGIGNFCGEELLTWALDPRSDVILPSSTRTVKAITEVESFALGSKDIKFVASQYRKLHSKQLRHKLRVYSPLWRTWSAIFIQAAWKRYKSRKLRAEHGKIARWPRGFRKTWAGFLRGLSARDQAQDMVFRLDRCRSHMTLLLSRLCYIMDQAQYVIMQDNIGVHFTVKL